VSRFASHRFDLAAESPAPVSPVSIGVDDSGDDRARTLATELGLPLIIAASIPPLLSLRYSPDGLTLVDHRSRRRSLRVDFDTLLGARRGTRLTRRDLFARAVGRSARTLVDATAGLGMDAMRLACFGLSVIAIERVTAIYALVRDARERATQHPAAPQCLARFSLVHGDARKLLPTLLVAPDAIYLDPMFPPKRRQSAATRKELALLRDLAGNDPDAAELLALSRRFARERVIVKRPNDQPPLAPEPTVSYAGKLVRYDVYRTDLR